MHHFQTFTLFCAAVDKLLIKKKIKLNSLHAVTFDFFKEPQLQTLMTNHLFTYQHESTEVCTLTAL